MKILFEKKQKKLYNIYNKFIKYLNLTDDIENEIKKFKDKQITNNKTDIIKINNLLNKEIENEKKLFKSHISYLKQEKELFIMMCKYINLYNIDQKGSSIHKLINAMEVATKFQPIKVDEKLNFILPDYKY